MLYEYDEQKHMEIVRDDAREEGIEAGIEAERVALIRKKMKRGLDLADITDLLELDQIYVKKIMDQIEENSDKTDLQIASLLIHADQETGASSLNLKENKK